MKTMTWMAAIGLVVLSGCSDKGDDTGGELVGDATAGAAVFSSACAGCHGSDGSGGSGPSLFDEVPGKTDADLTDIIQNGSGSMPAIGTDGQDLADLLAYLQATFAG